jgi:hypothetical protein
MSIDSIGNLNFMGIVQAIPLPVSLTLNFAAIVSGWITINRKKNVLTVLVVNHAALFLVTWTIFSMIAGLLITFEFLETTPNVKLFEGFLYGLHFAMTVMPLGVAICCVPLLWFFGRERNQGKELEPL